MAKALFYLRGGCGCSLAGHLPITWLVVWSLVPPACMPKCPWARTEPQAAPDAVWMLCRKHLGIEKVLLWMCVRCTASEWAFQYGALKQSRKALHKNQYQLTIHRYSDHAETASVTHHTGTILLLWFGGLYLTILSGSCNCCCDLAIFFLLLQIPRNCSWKTANTVCACTVWDVFLNMDLNK